MRIQNNHDVIRYQLGEDEFLKWEARNDALTDEESLTDDERDEMERADRAAWESEIPTDD